MKKGYNQEKYILHNKPKYFNRVDFAFSAAIYFALGFLVLACIITIIFVLKSAYDTAATLFVLAIGVSSYIYSTILARQYHVTEVAENSLSALRERWDELRNDEALLEYLAVPCQESELNPKIKLKLRLYLASILSVYSLIIHFIRRGYFRHKYEFAGIYEAILRSLFEYPYFIDIWRSDGVWGPGCLRNEYGKDLVFVVDNIIKEIESERSEVENSNLEMVASGEQAPLQVTKRFDNAQGLLTTSTGSNTDE